MTAVKSQTLAEFLLARIAKDEADARASAADAMVGWRWKHYPRDAYEEVQSLTLAHSKRVLAECEVNRQMVGLLTADCGDRRNAVRREWASEILKAFAAVYAEHPDYPRGVAAVSGQVCYWCGRPGCTSCGDDPPEEPRP